MKNSLLRQSVWAIVPALLLFVCSTGYAENIDPDNDGSQYAWGENVGWLNLEPGGDGGPGVEVAQLELTGYIWQENVGWINLAPTGGGGVVNDIAGNLSGYGWGENVGWINFNPTGGGVSIDPAGQFHGYAWGENIGWINFVPRGTAVKTSWQPDSDGDGSSDLVESSVPDAYGGGTGDGNGDGVPDEGQSHVTSLQSADGTCWITIVNDALLPQSAVRACPIPADAPPYVRFPFCCFEFTITGLPAGGTINITFFFPFDPSINGYWKRDNSGRWQNIATAIGHVGVVKTWVKFPLTDNSGFDENPAKTTIEDIGGPGVDMRMTEPIPTMTEWGVVILALLIAGSAVWFLRRRKRAI
jgi:hypothetical protein